MYNNRFENWNFEGMRHEENILFDIFDIKEKMKNEMFDIDEEMDIVNCWPKYNNVNYRDIVIKGDCNSSTAVQKECNTINHIKITSEHIFKKKLDFDDSASFNYFNKISITSKENNNARKGQSKCCQSFADNIQKSKNSVSKSRSNDSFVSKNQSSDGIESNCQSSNSSVSKNQSCERFVSKRQSSANSVNDSQSSENQISKSDVQIPCQNLSDSSKAQQRCETEKNKIEISNNCDEADFNSASNCHIKSYTKLLTENEHFKYSACDPTLSDNSEVMDCHKMPAEEETFECNCCLLRNVTKKSSLLINKTIRKEKCNLPNQKRIPSNVDKCRTILDPSIYVTIFRGNEVFNCLKCSFSVSDKFVIELHIKSHTDLFKCTFCPYTASKLTSFLMHKMDHTGRPFSCNYCPYTASKMSASFIHKLTHTENHQLGEVLQDTELLDQIMSLSVFTVTQLKNALSNLKDFIKTILMRYMG